MVEMVMKKVNKGFLRHFGDTEKAKLFNNGRDIHCAFDMLTVFTDHDHFR
jgi:hypothetical protein